METHAAYLAAVADGKNIKGFEPDGLFFIDPGNNKGVFTQLLGSTGALAQLGAQSGLLPAAGFDVPVPPTMPSIAGDSLPPMLSTGAGKPQGAGGTSSSDAGLRHPGHRALTRTAIPPARVVGPKSRC